MIDYDLLGFTKQTEMLLRSVGAQHLIGEFKSRNIATNALHKLTKEDFIRLGNVSVTQSCTYILFLLAY